MKLQPDEERLVRLAIYDNGNYVRDMQQLLASDSVFWKEYRIWQERNNDPNIANVRKEDSDWWDLLQKVEREYQLKGKKALQEGDDPIAENFRATHAARAAKAGSGSRGNLTLEAQRKIQEANELLIYGNPSK